MRELVQVGFGWSNAPDARTAGAQAVEKALDPLSDEAVVAFVFSTVDYNAEEVFAGVKSAARIVPIHGGTSFTGILTPEGFKGDGQGVVGVLAVSSPDIVLGVGGAELGDDPFQAGRSAAQLAFEEAGSPDWDPDLVLMLATPGQEEAVIQGIESVVEDVPIIGGSAADNTVEGHWRVFAGDRVIANGVVVTTIYNAPAIGWSYGSGYRPTAKSALVTRAVGRVLHELDDQPALEVYAGWTGKAPKALFGTQILGESILQPVAVYDEENDFYLVKHPGIAARDGSITLFAKIEEGDEVTLMEASVDDLIQEVGDTLRAAMVEDEIAQEKVAGALIIHCGGRRGAIGERMDEVVAQVKAAIGQAPFLGYCTFGEQGCLLDGTNVHCDLLLAVLVLGK